MLEELLIVCNKILDNIQENGLYRYDRMDFKWNERISLKTSKFYRLRPFILTIEEIMPNLLRKICRVEKRVLPTTFTFIANSYLLIEQNKIETVKKSTSIDIMQNCIDTYLSIENNIPWWNYNEEKIANVIPELINKRPTMHMHGLARCNMLLIKLGLIYNKPEWVITANLSAVNTINHHIITDYGDGTKSISYYYNTDDCVINVNSEFAMWLAMLENTKKENIINYCIINETLIGIIKMIIGQQNEDGSWFYNSKKYINLGASNAIDCHHTATIIYNLICIVSYEILEDELQNMLINTINKGMKYFLDTFFENPNKVKSFVGLKRPAGPTQYSEAIIAFCEYLKYNVYFDKNYVKKVEIILPYVLKKDISFINLKNGSAKSEKIFKWINIDSIRWGNGPVLEAIMRYIDYSIFCRSSNEKK